MIDPVNNAPLWFLLLTALVAAGSAIGAQWLSAGLTSRNANRRSTQELDHARQRLTQELEHHRDLERRKILHDRRMELYEEASALSFSFERTYADYLYGLLAKRGSVDDLHNKWQEKRSELSDLLPRLALIASGAVITSYLNLLRELNELLDELFEKEHIARDSLVRLDAAHMSFVRHMRIDLDATEHLPDALKEASNRYTLGSLYNQE